MQFNSRLLRSATVAGGLAVFSVLATTSQAKVLNFDDLPEPAVGALVLIPNSYDGFTITEAGTTNGQALALEGNTDYGVNGSYGNNYGAPSSPNAAYNDLGDGVTLTSATSFTFGGISVSAFANGGFNGSTASQTFPGDSARLLTISGSLNGVPVIAATPTITLSDTGYSVFNPGFVGPINSFTLTGSGSAQDSDINNPLPNDFFLIDNANVPEPASLGLLAISGTLFLARRRRA